MSQGEVKNPETDQRVDNKSGHQGRKPQGENRQQNRRSRDR